MDAAPRMKQMMKREASPDSDEDMEEMFMSKSSAAVDVEFSL